MSKEFEKILIKTFTYSYNPDDEHTTIDDFGNLIQSMLQSELNDRLRDTVIVSYIPAKANKKYKSHLTTLILHYTDDKELEGALSFNNIMDINKLYAHYKAENDINTFMNDILEHVLHEYTKSIADVFFK